MFLPTCETLIGDVRAKLAELHARGTQVHCVVTSPPYWGLRDYGTPPVHWRAGSYAPMVGLPDVTYPEWTGELGLEPDPIMFIGHLVEVFRALWPVLRDDGTLWVNMGDCHTDGGRGEDSKSTLLGSRNNQAESRKVEMRRRYKTLGRKQLICQPWRLGLALQADGWILRQRNHWHKSNPMPESARDRTTSAHEYVLQLVKSRYYYYDHYAIMEPVSGTANPRGTGVNPKAHGTNSRMSVDRVPRARKNVPSGWDTGPGNHCTRKHASPKDEGRAELGLKESTKFGRGPGWRQKQNESFSCAVSGLLLERNSRNVWKFPSESYKGAHFATFPRELCRRPILAGTSERGCCPHCEKPWKRVVEKQTVNRSTSGANGTDIKGKGHPSTQVREDHDVRDGPTTASRTIEWIQNCRCAAHQPVSCTVLDIFGGSGTTAEVAMKYGRNAILIDLNPKNEALMRERIQRNNGQGVLL